MWKTWLFVCYSLSLGWLCEGATVTYSIDDSEGYGRRFDGLGGLSGGGATSKLLVNYPKQQRDEILDYLFIPNYGASLHILKVEIGGDAQSTDGTEASHMHESWDENYQRGYEWWLMTEAKKRNPNILLYGLPWSFPGWLGNGTQNPYVDPEVTADYVIRWIMGAQTFYNLKIDIIGIWNEHAYSTTYIKILRELLDRQGLHHVRISAPDENGWAIVEDLLKDEQLSAAVDSIGSHYPGTLSVPTALQTGKQLWASEDYSTYNDNTGGGCWARLINQNYVNGMMTATISWNLIAAYYDGLPFSRDGLMIAMEPWSGNYRVEAPIWITAHTSQFTQPGWIYLRHGAGVGKLASGGSYVTFTDPKTNSLTVVIETMSHDHSLCIRPPLKPYTVLPQSVVFKLGGTFSNMTSLNVWYTKLTFDGSPSTMFKQMGSLQVTNGTVSLSLGVDEMYTLTTVSTGHKGTTPDPPPSQPFPLPYTDDFEGYPIHSEPYNLAQQTGVWEVADIGPPHGKVARQMLLQSPVHWCIHAPQWLLDSISVIGSKDWTDIYIEVEGRVSSVNGTHGVYVAAQRIRETNPHCRITNPLVEARVGSVNGTDGVYIAARIDRAGCNVSFAHGLYFFIYPVHQTYEVTQDIVHREVIKSGSAQMNQEWNALGLLIKDGAAVGWLNGELLFNVSVPAYLTSGFAGLGTTSPGIADFDNLQLKNSQDGQERVNEILYEK